MRPASPDLQLALELRGGHAQLPLEVRHDAVKVEQQPLLARRGPPARPQLRQGIQVGGVMNGTRAVHRGVVVVDEDAPVAQAHGAFMVRARMDNVNEFPLY